jgi:hypothetical protein
VHAASGHSPSGKATTAARVKTPARLGSVHLVSSDDSLGAARVPMARPRPHGHVVRVAFALVFAFASTVLLSPAAEGVQEGDVLIAFRDTLRGPDGAPPGPLRNWGTPGPCRGNSSSWYGVSCHGNGSVQGLQLERLGLAGSAPDLAVLAVLPGLRALSLSDNALTGAFPNVSALAVLKMLYLSRNRLSGAIPEGTFHPMRGLRKLHLSSNEFSGPVPGSITSPRLLELSLANNHFEGPLPDFSQPELRFVDVSNNNLSGPIPVGLSRFNASMFAGSISIDRSIDSRSPHLSLVFFPVLSMSC